MKHVISALTHVCVLYFCMCVYLFVFLSVCLFNLQSVCIFRSGAPLWLTFGVRTGERVKEWKSLTDYVQNIAFSPNDIFNNSKMAYSSFAKFCTQFYRPICHTFMEMILAQTLAQMAKPPLTSKKCSFLKIRARTISNTVLEISHQT